MPKDEGGSTSEDPTSPAPVTKEDSFADAQKKHVAWNVRWNDPASSLGQVPFPTARKIREVLLREGDDDDQVPRCELVPADPPPYGHSSFGPAYWDARHARHSEYEETFDWYMDYGRLGPVLQERLPPPLREAMPEILEVGFGCSEVMWRLYRSGWKNVIGIDSSLEAVQEARLAQRHTSRPELQFLQMDACQLGFPDTCFHAVIDKAIFDTIISDGHAVPKATRYLSEVFRVLRPGGVFILVSRAGVGARLPWLLLLPEWKWQIEVHRIPKPPPTCLGDAGETVKGCSHSEHFHVYCMTKSESNTKDADDEGVRNDGSA